MADLESLKSLAPLGIGGILAGIIFMFYRKDMKENAADWKGQSTILITVVKENTAAITMLIELVREMARTR